MGKVESNNSSKTLLIYNRDYHKEKPVTFEECINMKPFEIYQKFYSYKYRSNTGTYLMTDTLAKLIDAKWISPYDFESIENGGAKTIITNAFHCISPRFYFDRNYWQRVLDAGLKIVPMTCGFRYHEYGQINLSKDIIYILQQISERNEIGVRGEKSADILEKNGIRNIRIVGCQSLFYWHNREHKISKSYNNIREINFNFNQCYADFFEYHKDFCNNSVPFFKYFLDLFNQGNVSIKYSMQTSFFKEWISFNNFLNYDYIKEFPEKCGKYYFSVDDWVEGIKSADFSIGTQFHGSVAAILAGIPTLVVAIDDRMRELCKTHNIPYIDIGDFRTDKELDYYYNLSDYSEFNKKFSNNYDNFIDYCSKNGVSLRDE